MPSFFFEADSTRSRLDLHVNRAASQLLPHPTSKSDPAALGGDRLRHFRRYQALHRISNPEAEIDREERCLRKS